MRCSSGLAALLVAGVLACGEADRPSSWQSFDVESGTLEVELESPAAAAFGSHGVRFLYRSGGQARLLLRTELHNDGAKPAPEDVEVRRLDSGSWSVTLRGDEQADTHFRLDLTEGRARMREVDGGKDGGKGGG